MPDDHRTRTNEPVAGRGSEGQDAKRDGTGDAESVDLDALPSVTPKMEDYLRRIYRLQRESEGRVSNSTIAESLDVSRASVTSMLETLADRGLVDRERYRPVRLTETGAALALRVVRRHRLAETMLADLFDYALSEVDAEADVLEHHLSARFCRRLERLLGEPVVDPHGDPIPNADLALPGTTTASSLTDVEPSATVEVTRVLTQDDDTLDYLVGVGVEPGARVRLTETTPIGTVRLTSPESDDETTLPVAVASQVLVTVVDDTP